MELVQQLSKRLIACRIREYAPHDFTVCQEIYRSNAPDLLTEQGQAEFETFLEEGTSYQLVAERGPAVVACGALTLRGEGPYAHLAYGLVRRDQQQQGLGSTLLAARLSLLDTSEGPIQVDLVSRETSAPFFAQYGFHVHAVRPDPYRPGENFGHLLRSVTPEEVEAIRDLLPEHGVMVEIEEMEQPEDMDLLAED